MKWRKEGRLLIDHRNSPGISGEELAAAGLKHLQPMPAGVTWESATVTCAHCGVIVILNPNRSRPRGYCRKCDSYVCDHPDCSKECAPVSMVLDYCQEQTFRKEAGMNPLPPLNIESPLLKGN